GIEVTRVPAAMSAPGPASTTSATNSWPMTMPSDSASLSHGADPLIREAAIMSSMYFAACRSLPQMPQASTLASTWPGPGFRISISSIASDLPRNTIARIGLFASRERFSRLYHRGSSRPLPGRGLTRETTAVPRRQRLLIATNNPGKVREFRRLLADIPFEVVTPAEAGVSLDVDETGSTYAENALLKARAFAAAGA